MCDRLKRLKCRNQLRYWPFGWFAFFALATPIYHQMHPKLLVTVTAICVEVVELIQCVTVTSKCRIDQMVQYSACWIGEFKLTHLVVFDFAVLNACAEFELKMQHGTFLCYIMSHAAMSSSFFIFNSDWDSIAVHAFNILHILPYRKYHASQEFHEQLLRIIFSLWLFGIYSRCSLIWEHGPNSSLIFEFFMKYGKHCSPVGAEISRFFGIESCSVLLVAFL